MAWNKYLLIKKDINIKTIKKAIIIIIVFKSYEDCILLPPYKKMQKPCQKHLI